LHIHRRCVAAFLVVVVACLSLTYDVWAESAVERWLRVLGISVTPQTKGPGDEIAAGDIWVAELSGTISQRLTFDGGYRSPVFLSDDRAILALKGDSVVRLPVLGGEPERVVTASGVTKLIGTGPEKPTEALVLTAEADGRAAIGVLSLTDGRIAMLAAGTTPDERGMINRLKTWDRAYGDVKLTVESTTEHGLSGPKTWSDVYVTRVGQAKQNLSRCDDVDCGHPSLSHDKTRVVFVKADGR
jgi:hypothetical protein